MNGVFSGSDALLIGSAAAMGLAGSWHCALMCGPLCAVGSSLAGRSGLAPAFGVFLLGRLVGYAAVGGALAGAASWASHVVIRGGAGALSPWLALWAMAHAAVLSLGMWLAIAGRQPSWWALLGSRSANRAPVVRWLGRAPRTMRWGLAGGLWWLLPCGLLQSALVVATLASSLWAGAAVMAVFALASAPGLLAAPTLLGWLGRQADAPGWQRRLTRLSGLALAVASAWALVHGLWIHVRDYC